MFRPDLYVLSGRCGVACGQRGFGKPTSLSWLSNTCKSETEGEGYNRRKGKNESRDQYIDRLNLLGRRGIHLTPRPPLRIQRGGVVCDEIWERLPFMRSTN